MAKEVFMPKLSSTMEVGTLLQWFKEEGEAVDIGEPLFEIMTDKINIEVESYEEGVLLKKYYEVDAQIPVNAVIGFIGEENEEVPDESPTPQETDAQIDDHTTEPTQIEDNQSIAEKSEKVRATPAARRVARENDIELINISGSGPKGRVHEQDVADAIETTRATPLAEKIALDKGVDLNQVKGSGSRGKVEKSDVLQHLTANDSENGTERVKLSGLRKAVADKMVESSTNIPHVTLTSEVDMTHVMDIRQTLLPIIEKQTGYRLSITELIMKATASVLEGHPKVNASLIEDEIVKNKEIHIGLAVAVKNGLIVPSVKHVNQKGLAELTKVSKELGTKARDNNLLPREMSGSTFTISNLGMYAVDGFTPIINPPETAILGVGRIVKKPVVIGDEVVVRPMMVLSLSFDHRAIDGAPAAEFLTDLKERMENPYGLLV